MNRRSSATDPRRGKVYNPYGVGTGESLSVREFAQIAFQQAGYDYRELVIPDPAYFPPGEIYDLIADPSKVKEKLGWRNQYGFLDLIREMGESDLSNPG